MYMSLLDKNQLDSSYSVLSEPDLLALEQALGSRENGTLCGSKNGTPQSEELSKFLIKVQMLNGDALPSCLGGVFAPPLQHTSHPIPHTNKCTENERVVARKPRTRGLGKLTPEEDRYKRAIEHMYDVPDAMEFSLNLSLAQEGSLLSTTDPANLFEKRLNKYLRKHGLAGHPFAYAFDVNEDNRLHVHGVIPVKPEIREAVLTALMNTGGYVRGKAGSRQVKFGRDPRRVPDPTPAGWYRYTVECRLKVKRLFLRYGVVAPRTCNVSISYRRLIASK
ncbi:hypothetical protein [Paradevosia shaoguanensis]|uniref:hypothetical protein n=1 Tax=Paradevosia shaoguanensis TaxID=1335043 RepID=UPI0019329DCC|nr:hypothetical protein [Paradevosia shaoguanensis]